MSENKIVQVQDDLCSDMEDIEIDDDTLEGCDEGELSVKEVDGVVLEKNDRSLAEFYRWFQSGRLIVDPEWQRRYVWDLKRASKLIESFLCDIPVPVIYLAKNEDAKYEVIDGLQRLTSVFEFFDNKYPLKGVELLSKEYNGKKFRDLPDKVQSKIQDTTLRTFELSPRTPKDLMFVIFERLNTGGIALNDMEIRNCLYRGGLNILMRDLAKNTEFITCINQRNLEKRMDDRALILRFLAFYERTHLKARSGLKRFLNEFFDTYRNPPDEKLKEYEREFRKAMKACVTVFGNNAFRLRRDSQSGGGEWASRLNAAIFQVVAVSFTAFDLGQITRSADSIFEEYIDLISTDAKWCDYVRRATGETTRLEYVFDTWNNRLKLALANSQSNDSTRLFSRQLKEEMFQQSQQCEICGQRISLLFDAALDHDIHYWRGGKTVPENARLVHRHCNLSRPH
jgi:Protein of unknown function DUF262/HNH endonuclease